MAYRLSKGGVLIGKPSPEEEREFYERTSGGFVSYYQGSSPNLGAPRSPGPDQSPQVPASKPRGRGRRKAF